MFGDFARHTASGTPLYSALSAGIAKDDRLAGLLLQAPLAQRQPVLLFACVHRLLLEEPDDPLARFYPNLAGIAGVDGDPVPPFRRFCHARARDLHELLATRRTQTNEIGRTALLLPALASIEREVGALVHVDVGASAGLNLLIGHYDFQYQPGGDLAIGSPVRLTCATRGVVPVPTVHPSITVAVGVDPSPIDLDDGDQARWLEACVWPDQVERFERLRAAIGIARRVGVDVRVGDAVHDTAPTVDLVAPSGHPVVTTSWVMNYLSPVERSDFAAALDAIGASRDLSWIYAESPALCPELPGIPGAHGADQPTAVVEVRWRDGRRSERHLANAHPHGAWMHWLDDRAGALPRRQLGTTS